MNAALMDNGRHRNAATVAEAQASGEGSAVTGVTVTVHHSPTKETATERKARHAQATGTSRALWK